MSEQPSENRQEMILEAAFEAFATFGYRKTSMDDIARRVGMSRPALYLHFKNKEDITRRMIDLHYVEAERAIKAALSAEAPLDVLLATAFRAHAGKGMEVMMTSPHGVELLEDGLQVAADLIRAGEAHLATVYAQWLAGRARHGKLALPIPEEKFGAAITAALKGVKLQSSDYADYCGRLNGFAKLFAAALRV